MSFYFLHTFPPLIPQRTHVTTFISFIILSYCFYVIDFLITQFESRTNLLQMSQYTFHVYITSFFFIKVIHILYLFNSIWNFFIVAEMVALRTFCKVTTGNGMKRIFLFPIDYIVFDWNIYRNGLETIYITMTLNFLRIKIPLPSFFPSLVLVRIFIKKEYYLQDYLYIRS